MADGHPRHSPSGQNDEPMRGSKHYQAANNVQEPCHLDTTNRLYSSSNFGTQQGSHQPSESEDRRGSRVPARVDVETWRQPACREQTRGSRTARNGCFGKVELRNVIAVLSTASALVFKGNPDVQYHEDL